VPAPPPEKPAPRISEARAYLDLEDADRAVNVLDRLLEKDPESAEAWTLRARANLTLGLLRPAEADARQAIRTGGETAERLVLLAEATILRAPHQARAHLLKAIEADPSYARAHSLLARLDFRKGDREKAEERARAALALDPGDTLARSILDRLDR
jgi:Tfp pilus assembly protein PilF